MYSGGGCNSCGDSGSYGAAYGGDCGCNGGSRNHGVPHDPYLSGGSHGNVGPYDGQIIDQQIVGDQVIGSQVPGNATIMPPNSSDNFQPRPSGSYPANKFDADGNKILWEQPLPGGTTSL